MKLPEQPQTPAEGIALRGNWGDARSYEIMCQCGDPDHNHHLWVEADETGVSVNIYSRVKSRVWELSRWRKIWILLTRGYVDYEANICLTPQQAINYAETLKKSVQDVADFRKTNK